MMDIQLIFQIKDFQDSREHKTGNKHQPEVNFSDFTDVSARSEFLEEKGTAIQSPSGTPFGDNHV